MFLTPKIEKAIKRATALHAGQVRKGDGSPYIIHPYGVAFLLAHYIDDEDVICAGLLHDVLEDVPSYGAEKMREEFGERVYRIVKEVTEDRDFREWNELARKNSWKTRKEKYLENLKNDSREALLIAAADKIHNLRSLIDSYAHRGEEIWNIFSAGKTETLWFYGAVEEIISERLSHPLADELKRAFQEARQAFDADLTKI